MTAMKKYFLYVFMLNSLCLNAMDNNSAGIDLYIEEICDTIDKNHLKLDYRKNSWFKPIVGAIYSYYKSHFLNKEIATAEIETIESYIPSHINKADALNGLVEKHWYVDYLMQLLLKEKLDELEQVTGSTIDALYKPDFTNDNTDIKEIIYQTASTTFFSASGIYKPIYYIPNRNNDIHYTVLYGHIHEINPHSLIMSSDGNYLRTKDYNKQSIIWDTKNGIQTTLNKNKKITWRSGSYRDFTMDINKNYCAISINNSGIATGEGHSPSSLEEMERPGKLRVKVDYRKPAIVLYKCPEEISHLCQNAFYKSKNDLAELTALLNSNSMQAIEGFPRKNLQKLIASRVSQLSQ